MSCLYIKFVVILYKEQMLCVIHVDVLSPKLDEKTMRCSSNGTIISHLYHADNLALIAPSPNGMQKLITGCDAYDEMYGLKFD